MLSARPVLALLAALGLAATAPAQSTWHVNKHATAPGDGSPQAPYTSVQYAIDQVTTASGDTLLIAPGVYQESISLIGKNLELRSTSGAASTTFSGAWIDAGAATLEGLTLEGGVHVQFSFGAYLERCVIRSGSTGVSVVLGDAHLRQSSVVGNVTGISVASEGLLTIENSIVWGNQGNDYSAGIIPCAKYSAGNLPNNGCGIGNISDPGNWDAGSGDANLVPAAASIDAADPTLPPDADGSPADIGALPFEPSYAPTPSIYCNIKQNSDGCKPPMRVDGFASTTNPRAFQVGAVDMIGGQPALLWYSLAGSSNMLVNGIKNCTAAPRTLAAVVQASGSSASPCSGFVAYDFNALIQSGLDPALSAGTMVNAHYWYRDPLLPAGGGWTNAVRFGIGL